jgi:hypothetical protein
MRNSTFNAAHKRFWTLQVICLFMFFCAWFAGRSLVPSSGQTSQAIRTLAAALQIVPILLYIASTARFLRQSDDYLRQIGHEALAFAGGWTIALIGVVAPLQRFELIGDFPEILFLVVFQIASFGRFGVLVKKPINQGSKQG